IIAHFATSESADLVIVGKQAIDGDNAQTAPMVAGLLGWSQGTFVCGVEAKKKPINTVDAASLGIDLGLSNKVVSVEDPPTRKAGIVVETVDDLVAKLKNEAGVI
ncbi:ETFB, partial [Symbiodinium microadriaticum]